MKKISLLLVWLLLISTLKTFAQSSCNASYTWAPSQSTSSNALGVNFTNSSTGASGPAGYFTWSHVYFGDGASSFIATNAFHNYATPGTYSTMLVVQTIDTFSSNLLCSDTAYQTVTINYLPCAVAISAIDNNNGTATFTANALGGTTGMTYNWSFGDGTTGTGSPVTHTYSVSGYHWILLTSSGAGCSGSDSMYFNNTDSNALNCSALSASFSNAASGLTVFFNNTSTTAASNIQNQGDWYFGDGSPAQIGNYGGTSHTYAAAGTYNVTLINHWVDSLSGQLYCVDSVTQSVVVDSSTFPNVISGYISWDSLVVNSDSIKVWLITYDSIANTLAAIDSTYTSVNFPLYTFNNPAAGIYWVKAAVLNQTIGTTGLLPTYYTSSVYWGAATTIYHSGGYDAGRNIYMQTGTVTSGPGFIAGNVSSGAGKGTGTGVEGLLIYLRGANNVLIASAITDVNGDYSFSHIPVGTYNVYPELMNYQTTPFNAIAVTTAQASVSAIDFEKSGNEIKPKNKPTSIATISKQDGLSVYPNPAKNQLLIESKNGLFNKVVIVNTLGQSVQESKLTNGVNKINLSAVNAGVYYLLISGADQTRSMKIIKE